MFHITHMGIPQSGQVRYRSTPTPNKNFTMKTANMKVFAKDKNSSKRKFIINLQYSDFKPNSILAKYLFLYVNECVQETFWMENNHWKMVIERLLSFWVLAYVQRWNV